VTRLLARHLKSLQAVPIRIGDWPPIYMDLRSSNAHFWLSGTPFKSSPHEVDEQTVMRRFVRRGSVAFDVGANLGLHTLLLAELVGPLGQVAAFEPNAELIPMLELTVKGLSNATLYPYALSNRNSESTLFVPDDYSMASLADWTSAESLAEMRRKAGMRNARTITCQERRLDDLVNADVIARPDFIKCDVEGAELLVFTGGRHTLDRDDAPLILFESRPDTAGGFGLKATDAASFLLELPRPGYQFVEVREGGRLQEVSPCDFTCQNILAVPRARRDVWLGRSDSATDARE
jgi:FkbM family methyltransferase